MRYFISEAFFFNFSSAFRFRNLPFRFGWKERSTLVHPFGRVINVRWYEFVMFLTRHYEHPFFFILFSVVFFPFLFFFRRRYLIRNKGHPMLLTTCASLIENVAWVFAPRRVFFLKFRRRRDKRKKRPFSSLRLVARVRSCILTKLLTYNLACNFNYGTDANKWKRTWNLYSTEFNIASDARYVSLYEQYLIAQKITQTAPHLDASFLRRTKHVVRSSLYFLLVHYVRFTCGKTYKLSFR